MKSKELKWSRGDVYVAINSEREYQEQLSRNDVTDQRPLEQLALIEHVILEAKAKWYTEPGLFDMNYMRKIAAIAVRCMEQHGAPLRRWPVNIKES
jgi:hypothetical protein